MGESLILPLCCRRHWKCGLASRIACLRALWTWRRLGAAAALAALKSISVRAQRVHVRPLKLHLIFMRRPCPRDIQPEGDGPEVMMEPLRQADPGAAAVAQGSAWRPYLLHPAATAGFPFATQMSACVGWPKPRQRPTLLLHERTSRR